MNHVARLEGQVGNSLMAMARAKEEMEGRNGTTFFPRILGAVVFRVLDLG